MGWKDELRNYCLRFSSEDVRRINKSSPQKFHTDRLNYLRERIRKFLASSLNDENALYFLCAAFDKWRRNDPNEYAGAMKSFRPILEGLRENLPWPTSGIDTVCVFACGTGHDHYEIDDLLFPKLYSNLLKVQNRNLDFQFTRTTTKLTQRAYLIDGIASKHEWEKTNKLVKGKKNIARGITGMDLKDKAERCVKNVLEDDPSTVILVGHSRGAVISLEIAKRLNEAWLKDRQKNKGKKICLFVIDPVNMATWQGFKDGEKLEGFVEELNIMVMSNVSESIDYPLTIPAKNKNMKIHLMPGTHGTATQMHKDQVIGWATYYWILDWMESLGVTTYEPVFKPMSIADDKPKGNTLKDFQIYYFDKINEWNPWVVVREQLGRATYDYGDDIAKFRPVAHRRKRRNPGKEAKRLSDMAPLDFTFIYNRRYVNSHHYRLINGPGAVPTQGTAKTKATINILDKLDKALRKRSWQDKAKVYQKNQEKDQKTTWSSKFEIELHCRTLSNK